ncbi:MAG TPA: SDR family oxidoreductase [Kiritimatiellia bacterium]|nr:SDR family oxidoreductase [Kiritimatiellia bacterium]
MNPLFVLITGCTRGCGRALVDWFIQQGHIVAGCGRNPEHIHALAKTYPPPHHFAAIDVTDDPAVGAWIQTLLRDHHAPDLVLNNAALINHPTPLWDVPPSGFSNLIDVNIKGVFHIIRHALPPMIERASGVIVNFSSGWGRSVDPGVAPYCTTKWAIEGLSQALAEDLPNGLASVALSPGIINTDMLQTCWGDGAERFPSPETWAKTAGPFLVQLGPRHNGQSLSIPTPG